MSSGSQRRRSIDKLKSMIRSRSPVSSARSPVRGQFSSSSSSTVCTNGLCEETVTRTTRDKSGKLVTKKETREYPMKVSTRSNMVSAMLPIIQFPMVDFDFPVTRSTRRAHKCNCPYCTF